jgi:peptidoglycan/LPS O-acetylase OafA/YrhL
MAIAAAACGFVQLVVFPLPPLGSFWGGFVYIVMLSCPFIPYLFIGMIIYANHSGRLSILQTYLLSSCLLFLFALMVWTSQIVPQGLKYCMSFCFALFLFETIRFKFAKFKKNRYASFLSGISYPLYVVHPVMGYVLLSKFVANGTSPYLALLAAVSLAFSVAFVLHQVVELPTQKLGKRFLKFATT